ncbi:hypothetical protein CRG98_017740 [Punica granatum]|uniref:LOB domain-containing protein n=1 Tax=Punica granatum TaxID=22663 RepID=A0A2I0JZY2_PUNGR|nr:hypothetical protein CRG98_017740 [Punica granatum]
MNAQGRGRGRGQDRGRGRGWGGGRGLGRGRGGGRELGRGRASHHQTCAACRHQRRRCEGDCRLAPYFPLSRTLLEEIDRHEKELAVVNQHLEYYRRGGQGELDPSLAGQSSIVCQVSECRFLTRLSGDCQIATWTLSIAY